MEKVQVTEMTVMLVSYSRMLLDARVDGQSGSRRKKEEKNTMQIRVTPGPFELALLGNLIKFEDTMWQFPLLMEYIVLKVFQSCPPAFAEKEEFMLMKNTCLLSLVSPSGFILHDFFFN